MAIKPPDCTCRYPEIMNRNGSGHANNCPAHLRWQRERKGENDTGKIELHPDDKVYAEALEKFNTCAPSVREQDEGLMFAGSYVNCADWNQTNDITRGITHNRRYANDGKNSDGLCAKRKTPTALYARLARPKAAI